MDLAHRNAEGSRRCRAPLALVLLGTMVLGVVGCPKEGGEVPAVDATKVVPAKDRTPPPTAPDPAVADITYDAKARQDPARQPAKPSGALPPEVTIRSILIRYLSAKGGASVTRTKVAAAKRAALLAKIARSQGASFVELARKYSEDPEAKRGLPRRIAPHDESWAKAGFSIGEGQVTDPIDAPRGLRVLLREAPGEYSSAHIVVIFKGSLIAPVGLKRTKKEARAKAERVLKQVQKGNARFSVHAARYSDSPSGSLRGGVIAPLHPETAKPVMKPYLEALKKTKVNAVHGEIVETGYGFHVIKRLPLRKVYIQHLLVAHNDSGKFKPKERRDKWTAKSVAEKLHRKAKVAGADFDALVAEHSDDHETAARGGRLAPASRGEMHPRLEQFAFGLKVGQVSQPLETEFGFHIIKRLR